MIYFINDSTDPYYNLALEEVLLTSDLKTEIMLLWQNLNTIVVGRNQNTIEEINLPQVKADNVSVVRRLTGGGAVFHDSGNLNFTFIKNVSDDRSYSKMLQPIIAALKTLGLPAEFAGKNDIEIDGKKISGNAQYIYHNRLLHHGTILFDVNLSLMSKYLNVDKTKMLSKGVKSIPARVINIKTLLSNPLQVGEFKSFILMELAKTGVEVAELPLVYHQKAVLLADRKYRQWDWNFGQSPEFTYRNKKRFVNKGTIDVLLNVDKGKIIQIKFYGDFLGSSGTEPLEVALVNCPYDPEHIQPILEKCNYQQIFGTMFTADEILTVLFDNSSI